MLGRKKQDASKLDTLIGQGTAVEGKLHSKGSMRIEGFLTGDIASEGDVTIGEKAVTKSNIRARHVWIAGSVVGHVQASGTLTILKGGSLEGDTACNALVIEEGGIFAGHSRMQTHGQERKASDEPAQTQS